MDIEQIKEAAIPACREFNVKRLDLFGSLARGEESESSDIDLLVEFADIGYRPAGRFFGLLHRVEDTLGRRIDLLSAGGLKNPSTFAAELCRRGSRSMDPELLKHLYDLQTAVTAISRFVEGKSYQDYAGDDRIVWGVIEEDLDTLRADVDSLIDANA